MFRWASPSFLLRWLRWMDSSALRDASASFLSASNSFLLLSPHEQVNPLKRRIGARSAKRDRILVFIV